jgi:serine/threonine protein kinase
MTGTSLSTFQQGRYSLISVVADEQTYSRVFRCTDLADGSLVAIKQARRSTLTPGQRRFATRLFQREAGLLAALHHPDLPSLRDVFEEQEALHLVMDFIEGETLQARLDQLRREGKRLPIQDSMRIGLSLCGILAYLHGQSPSVIHRDIKPANVILRGNRVFLLDFGIARRFTQDPSHLLLAPSTRQAQGLDTIYNVGTRGYAPREQYGESASTSPQSDIYSLGALLHYLLSGQDPGRKPVAQFTFAPLRLPLLPALAALVARMTEEASTYRPDIDDVRETLEACCREFALPSGIGPTTGAQGRNTPVVAHV